MNITIYLKDGQSEVFRHEGRAGGSYTKSLRYEGDFAIVRDEWDRETAFPSSDIKKIVSEPNNRGY